jgi:hypothetical protein
VFNTIDLRLLGFFVAVVVLGVAEVGYQLSKRSHDDGKGAASGAGIQAAMFTIVGLLLAFCFSLALGRFDARRAAVVTEANAIGTAILRTDLLDDHAASRMRAYLKDYLEARIAFVASDADEDARVRSDVATVALQRQMWSLTAGIARRSERSTELPLFIASLNTAFDASTLQAGVTTAHIPDAVMTTLIIIVLIAVGVLGSNTGRSGDRNVGPMLLLAVTLGLVIGIILDLDHPQRGMIQVNLAALTNDRQLFNNTAMGGRHGSDK